MDMSCSFAGKLNYPQLIYRLSAFSVKSWAGFFVEID